MKFDTMDREDFEPVTLTLESKREAALLMHVLITGRAWNGSSDPIREMYYGTREVCQFDEDVPYSGRSRDVSNGLYRSS